MPLYRDLEGRVVDVSEQEGAAYGYTPLDAVQSYQHDVVEGSHERRGEATGALGTFQAGALGVLSGFTGGVSDVVAAEATSKEGREQAALAMEANPYVRMGGEVVGSIAGAIAPAGSVMGNSVAGVTSRAAGQVAEQGIARGGVAGYGAALGAMGAEGAMQNVGQYLGHAAIEDKEATAEGLAGAIGSGFGFGAAGGGAALGIQKGTIAARRMFSRVMDGGKNAAVDATNAWEKARGDILTAHDATLDAAKAELEQIRAARREAEAAELRAGAAVRAEQALKRNAVAPQPAYEAPMPSVEGAGSLDDLLKPGMTTPTQYAREGVAMPDDLVVPSGTQQEPIAAPEGPIQRDTNLDDIMKRIDGAMQESTLEEQLKATALAKGVGADTLPKETGLEGLLRAQREAAPEAPTGQTRQRPTSSRTPSRPSKNRRQQPGPVEPAPEGDYQPVPREERDAAAEQFLSKLTPDEQRALNTYQSSSYKDINKGLRGERIQGGREKMIATLDSVIERSPASRPMRLYRGLAEGDTKAAAMFENMQPGDQFIDRAYSSTSTHPTNWRRDINLVIDVPAGYPAAPLKVNETSSNHGNIVEDEILLRRGTKYEYVGRTPDGDYHVRVMPEDGPGALPAEHIAAPGDYKLRIDAKPFVLVKKADAMPEVSSFADDVQAAARRAEHKFGENKAFISSVYESMPARSKPATLDEFKSMLDEAAQRGDIKLGRADMVGGMDPAVVAASELRSPRGADFHFVVPEKVGLTPKMVKREQEVLDALEKVEEARRQWLELEEKLAGSFETARKHFADDVVSDNARPIRPPSRGDDLPFADWAPRRGPAPEHIEVSGEDIGMIQAGMSRDEILAARGGRENNSRAPSTEDATRVGKTPAKKGSDDVTVVTRKRAEVDSQIEDALERGAVEEADALEKQLGGTGTLDDIGEAAEILTRYEEAAANLADVMGDAAHPMSREAADAFRKSNDEAVRRAMDRVTRAVEDAETFGPERMSPKDRVAYAKDRRAEAGDELAGLKMREADAEGSVKDATRARKVALKAHDATKPPTRVPKMAGAAEAGGVLELLNVPGLPKPSDLPVVGPLLGAYLKYRAVKAALGRFTGRVPATADSKVAALAARTKDRVATAIDRSLKFVTAPGGPAAAAKAANYTATISRRIFDDGEPDAKSNDIREQAAVRVRELAAYVNTPGAIERDVRRELRDVSDPDVILAAEKHRRAAMEWLLDQAPKGPPQEMLAKHDWSPSAGAAMKLARQLSVFDKPELALDAITRGDLTVDMAATLRSTYPRLFGLAQVRMLERSAEIVEKLPYRHRALMSLLFDTPLETSLSPQHIQIVQESYKMPAGPASPPMPENAPPVPSVSGDVTINALYQPGADRRAMR